MEVQIPQDIVRSVFRSVWEDFYGWERAYCLSAIKTLAFSYNAAHFSDHITSSHNLRASGQHPKTVLAPPQPSSHATDQLRITFLDYTQGTPQTAANAMVEIINAPRLSTPPAYESVTPTTRSIHQGDDDDSMAFVPYSDDPEFDAFEHTLRYSTFSWQDKFRDPDCERAQQQ